MNIDTKYGPKEYVVLVVNTNICLAKIEDVSVNIDEALDQKVFYNIIILYPSNSKLQNVKEGDLYRNLEEAFLYLRQKYQIEAERIGFETKTEEYEDTGDM